MVRETGAEKEGKNETLNKWSPKLLLTGDTDMFYK